VIATLRNTFLHIPGVSQQTEQQIWKNDVYTWEEFLEGNGKLRSLPKSKVQRMQHSIKDSIAAMDEERHDYFSQALPMNLHWRAYREFRHNCCFLDIETTGLDKQNDDLTLIGLYDGEESQFFIKDRNLDAFQEAIQKYSMIVTFNGRCFDVPFIQAKYPGITFDQFHVDLRYALRDVGYKGGLKRIERALGISRGDVEGVDGLEAVRLWYKYKRGDQAALDRLLAYNEQDIVNLKTLMHFAFDKLKEKEFFSIIG
jgi:hypothetical protein